MVIKSMMSLQMLNRLHNIAIYGLYITITIFTLPSSTCYDTSPMLELAPTNLIEVKRL
jgi:hypothetical protein